MKRGIGRKWVYIIGIVFISGLTGCNDDQTFELYDTDLSGALNKSEFEEAFNKADWFAHFDINNNNAFENSEFILASFDYWDDNDDDVLEEEEYDDGVKNFYYPYHFGVYGTYEEWDIDDDNTLEEDEFGVAYVNTAIFQTTDTNKDKNLSEEELSNLMFKAMDEDNDGEISKSEFHEDVLVKFEN